MYAVVTTGGKQFRVSQGTVMRVEKLDAPVGDTIELTKVSMIAKDSGIVVDAKKLVSAKVVCEVVDQDRAKKIRVYKNKRRKNYKRTHGHRQPYTELRVREIVA
jgi:large subunit ribosomal protein L21